MELFLMLQTAVMSIAGAAQPALPPRTAAAQVLSFKGWSGRLKLSRRLRWSVGPAGCYKCLSSRGQKCFTARRTSR